MKTRARLALLVLIFAALARLPAGGEDGGSGRPPRVGLVLSGGGALGFAHIGVIRVLEELGLPVDFVAGASMGSIIGGLYATGYDSGDIVEAQEQVRWDELFLGRPARRGMPYLHGQESFQYLFEVPVGRKGRLIESGLLDTRGPELILALLTSHCSDVRDFDRLPVPFRAVATDLVSGRQVVFREGSLVEAIRASMAIPGVFEPVRTDGRVLVDGGVLDNLPVSVAREAGCEFVIAVDLSRESSAGPYDEPLSVLSQSIMMMIRRETERQRELADLVIAPEVGQYTAADFDEAERLVEVGERAARAKLPELLALGRRAAEAGGGRQPGAGAEGERRPARRLPVDTVIADVRIEGADIRDAAALQQALADQVDARLDVWEVYRQLAAVYSPDRYDGVSISLRDERGRGAVLLIRFDRTPFQGGSGAFRFGYSLRGLVPYYEEDVSVLASLVFQDISGPGSLWEWDLYLLEEERLEMEYFQPLSPVFFGSLLLSGLYDSERVFLDGEPAAELNIARLGVTARAGVYLRRLGELYAGYRIGHVRSSVELSSVAGLDSFSGTVSSVVGGWTADTLERSAYPGSGGRAALEVEASPPVLGGDNHFLSLELAGRRYFPLGRRHVLGLSAAFGTDFDQGLELYQRFGLGGAGSLPGYRWDAVTGTTYGLLSVEYRYLLAEDLIGDLARQRRLYAWLRAAAGNAWESFPERFPGSGALRGGVLVGIGIDTLVGAAAAELGVSSEGDAVLYVTAGNVLR